MCLIYKGIAGLKVWVIGSSVMKRDLLRPGEIQMGLTRLGLSPWCQGRYGMSLDNLRRQVEIITTFEDTPAFIFIHIGDK
jgi:hypothetical protein